MSYIQVVDRDGWEKRFELTRRIMRVGSAAGSDIVLSPARGAGVAPAHLQLILPANGPCRMINLSAAEVRIGGIAPVPPRGAVELRGGERIQIGDFALLFEDGGSDAMISSDLNATPSPKTAAFGIAAAPTGDLSGAALQVARTEAATASSAQAGANIGLDVALASTEIRPGQNVAGIVTVKNLGSAQAVQIQLNVSGLQDCCDIAPGPILFPGASRNVALKIEVPETSSLKAGRHRLEVHAAAPAAYPGETGASRNRCRYYPTLSAHFSVGYQRRGRYYT